MGRRYRWAGMEWSFRTKNIETGKLDILWIFARMRSWLRTCIASLAHIDHATQYDVVLVPLLFVTQDRIGAIDALHL